MLVWIGNMPFLIQELPYPNSSKVRLAGASDSQSVGSCLIQSCIHVWHCFFIFGFEVCLLPSLILSSHWVPLSIEWLSELFFCVCVQVFLFCLFVLCRWKQVNVSLFTRILEWSSSWITSTALLIHDRANIGIGATWKWSFRMITFFFSLCLPVCRSFYNAPKLGDFSTLNLFDFVFSLSFFHFGHVSTTLSINDSSKSIRMCSEKQRR